VFLKELCVLYDSVFQTSTSNLKFSRRVAEITEHSFEAFYIRIGLLLLLQEGDERCDIQEIDNSITVGISFGLESTGL